jgi:putative hemolysin
MMLVMKLSNTYIVSGLASIDEVNEVFSQNISSNDFDTIGGFILTLLGSIPKEDKEYNIEYDKLSITITKVNENRIEELKISINS